MKNSHTREPNRQPCNGCGSNLTCFVVTEVVLSTGTWVNELWGFQYQRMKQFEGSAQSLSHDELLRRESTNEDSHFFPQNWQALAV